MSRSAAQVLEFDQLKEIVGGYTTCVAGRRVIEALAPQQDVVALDAEFILVGEAAGYLRAGSELGFGSFADPEQWLARLAVPASVLSVAEFLDASSLLEIASSVRQLFKADAAKYPQLAGRAAAARRFSASGDRDSPRDFAERGNQRRCFAAVATHSRGDRARTRDDPAFAGKYFARARRNQWRGGRRGLRDAAE